MHYTSSLPLPFVAVLVIHVVSLAVVPYKANDRTHPRLMPREEDGEATNVTTIYERPDEHQLCVRADDPEQEACMSTSSASWLDGQGNLIPWQNLAEGAMDDFWQDATVTGTSLKALMDKYVGQGISGLTQSSSNQNALFNRNYVNACTRPCTFTNPKLRRDASRVNDFFRQAGIPSLNYESGFQIERYVSAPNGKRAGGYVLAVATNSAKSTIVSTWPLVEGDGDLNKLDERAYTSTLTWNAWAESALLAGGNPSNLKYHLRDQIFDRLSANILAATHLKYPKEVDNIAMEYTIDSFSDRLDQAVVAGHGRWTPSHPAYTTLLAIPHIKTMVNMVIDYNDKMDNNYIAAIHTWPELNSAVFPNMPAQALRRGEILIEYGPSTRFSLGGNTDPGHIVATS